MKVSIRDTQTLKAIAPLDVAAYLRSRGWREATPLPGKGALWHWTAKEADEFEVALPLERSVADYAQRISELLRTLETVEDRSQLEILEDVVTTSADIIRIPATYNEASDGSVPIDDGVSVIQSARDLLLASACAAVQAKAVYQKRKPTEAVDYMKNVRLGQTGRGSYYISLISRVPPTLSDTKGQKTLLVEDPFERRVIHRLAVALGETHRAAQRAGVSGEIDTFMHAV
jgi:hypothetical protein